MTSIPFKVRAWAAWCGGQEVRSGTDDTGFDITPPPVLLRRRVSPIGQRALKAAWQLPDSASARLVFSSRQGEFNRTLSILDAIGAGTEVSPADFTLSVHNALAGLLSIARRNREGHTTVAAGPESFGFAMIEALALLTENPARPVVLVHFEEPMPAPYDALDIPPPEPIGLAMSLAAADGGDALNADTCLPLNLTVTPRTGPRTGYPNLAGDFLRFLMAGDLAVTVSGDRFTWLWRRSDALA